VSEDELSDEIFRHLVGSAFTLKKPKKLAVAVSGGGDSMACLDLMIWTGREIGFVVEAVTLDHGLRREAADEIALVAAFCASCGVSHSVLTWGWDGTGNLQAAARGARYGLIGAWAVERGVDCVALGHTKDDVAETFLMRLARQAGVDGLAQMEHLFEREGVQWVRPLLAFGRTDLRTYLTRHGVGWAEDASNEDATFERVKARQVLRELAPLGIDTETLANVARNISVAKATLNAVLRETVCHYVREDRGDLILPSDLPEDGRLIPMEIMDRLRRAAIRWVGGGDYAPRSQAMAELDIGLQESTVRTLGGCVLTRTDATRVSERRFRITREYNAVKDVVSSTDTLWDGRWSLTGPHSADLQVRALGEAVKDCPDWRETGLPRQSLLASPAVWRGDELIAAPLAGLRNGWEASATGRGSFTQFLLSR